MLRLAATIAALGALAAPAVSQAATEPLPAGATVAGVPVGGLEPAAATQALEDALGPVYVKRPIAIRVAHHDTLVTPGQAGLVIYYDWMVKRAVALAHAHKPVSVPLHLGVKDAERDAAIASVAKRFYRAPRDARVRFGVTAVRRVRARLGTELDQARVRAGLERELRHPTTGRVVAGRVLHVRPAVTTAGLRKRYPAYISVDRSTHTLRLFRALRLVRTYPVAVGAQGFEDAAGAAPRALQGQEPLVDGAEPAVGLPLPGPDVPARRSEQPAARMVHRAGRRHRDPRHERGVDGRQLGLARVHPHARDRRERARAAGSRRHAGADPLKALDALRRDPVMARLVDQIGPLSVKARKRGRPDDAYGTLVRSITGQQLSTKAAATIYGRLTELYDGRTPTPQEILDTDPQQLREVGLSGAKAAYLRDLAEHIVDGELPIDELAQMSDHEVSEALIAIKGLGRWTVDMFLMFHLGRPDILPVGDLGIRKAVQIQYGLAEMPKPSEMETIAEAWRPHRTLASLYLWESLDNRPSAGKP